MYTASIQDPIDGAVITVVANTQASLRAKVTMKIDGLRTMIVDLYLPGSATISLIIFLFIVAINLTSFGLVVMPLLTAAYLRGAPFWINPLRHIWYLYKCMRAWGEELERISAPDTRMA